MLFLPGVKRGEAPKTKADPDLSNCKRSVAVESKLALLT